ncbi:hypothetical protein QA645_23575 [Bradyrhizobium sp. CIAT3101]|uniref:hypothetical protein n=1 Tax=Bradyrhizobium sp. CIAT3101 TaxID=439387 RepID=UPI0024B285CF|nr:hypothetical protein [Bradyrhizobium sp. CIAT3101]WFU77539.1 hypothetical protein QA645_23575 [Bradyrhizobium sp. CIAT3101]
MRFGGGGLLRLGDGLGRNHGLGADRCDRRGRLVGMIMVVMIVRVVMTMVVMIVSVVLVIMGVMMIIVLMIVMPVIVVIMVMMIVVVTFVLAVMLGIGVQVLALMRRALGVQGLALDRLGRGIGAGVENLDDVAADALAMTAAAGVAVARAAAAVGTVLALFLGFAMGLLFGLDQRLPVGDRDLVIVGMDFAEGKEAVAVAAIFNESGLERGFDPCDLGEVDIPAQLLALRGLEVKLFDAIAADHDDPGLFRVGGIDQHLVGHVLTLGGGGRDRPWARRALPGDATVHLIRG